MAEATKSAARSVLFTCIDTGLNKLIASFMPFISEELWQRLPRPEVVQRSLPPSICIASYPKDEEFNVWKDQTLEEDVKLISRIIASVRSVRASHMLPNKTKTKLVLRCRDLEAIEMIGRFANNISTLAFCQPVTVSTDGESTCGCAVSNVSEKCDAIIHLEVKVSLKFQQIPATKVLEGIPSKM